MQFADGIGGTGTDSSRSIQVDSSGNSYVTGFFNGTMDFDPGAGTTNLTSAGGSDIYFAKYDSSGALVWAKNVGGTGSDVGYSIAIDGSGNSYVTGYFIGTADFDPGAGTTNLTSIGSRDIYIAKYDSNGDLLWAKNVGGTGSDISQSIAVDSSGNSYITGQFLGTADFDPGAGTTNLTSNGSYDVFIARYDSSGALVWANNVGGTNTDNGQSIAIDSSGNNYVTGTFDNTVDFDPGAGTTNLTSAGGTDTFIAKYDSSGALVWAKNVGGTGNDYGQSITIDGSGNSYVTGYFAGTADFDPGAGTANLTSAGANDTFIARYDSSGNLVWANNVGGTGNDAGLSITVDSSGNSYVAGYFQGTADFDPGVGTTNLTSAGGSDIYFAKYDSSGALVWAKSVGGTGDDQAFSIQADGNDNVYVTGHFNGTADFDPGAGTETLTSAGDEDVFILKLDSDGNFVSVSSEPANSGSASAGLTKTDRTAGDIAGTETGHTLVNNTGANASGNLVEGSGNGNTVTVTLPGTVSISNAGTASAVASGTAGTTLTSRIQATGQDSTDQSLLDTHGQSFVTSMSGTATDIRSLGFSSTGSTAETVQITGQGSSGTEAFVIDASGLPSGSTIQLDNIEFAAIVGSATVTGGAGQNYVVGDSAAQFISLGDEDDTLAGGGGADTVGSGWGDDIVYGNQGSDYVFGGGGLDTLYGGQDGDIVLGNNDNDLLYGNRGNDTLSGGENDDVLYGGKDEDIVYGNSGNDNLHGNLGNDTVYGGQGNDAISGGAGDDYLVGGKDDDTLVGGDGADSFVFEFGGGNDTVSDFTAGADSVAFETGLDVASATETDGNTVLTLSDGGTVTLTGVAKSTLLEATGWLL